MFATEPQTASDSAWPHGKDVQWHDLPGLVEYGHEDVVFFGLLKNRWPSHRSIENVEDLARRANSFGSRRHQKVTPHATQINET